MINLEQVRLLENKVAKAVDYIEKVAGENAALLQKDADMQARLESNQKRIDELEVLIMRFKEEQGQIEDGILAALDRLSRFEEAMDKSLKGKTSATGKSAVKETPKPAEKPAPEPPSEKTDTAEPVSGGEDICFEILEDDDDNDIDPLDDILDEESFAEAGDPPAKDGELDIF